MKINVDALNPEQLRAVTHQNGPLLIVAGAGTGKTTVITQRIGWLIEQQHTRADQILALTFTEKAAGEMTERVDELLPYGYVDLWISTFHAFAEKLLHLHALDIGIPNDFKLLNSTEQWMLVRRNLEKFDLDFYKPLGNPTKFIHALLKLFSRAKDEVIDPAAYLKYAEDLKLNSDSTDFIKTLVDADQLKTLSKKERKELVSQEIVKTTEIASAYHVYQQLLLENNALDFGDLINYCLQLLKQRPKLLAKYRQQFKYVLVDEFQDTNYAQYELVKLLGAPNNNITVVGDDDQSIYKFRGASISNILEFKKDFAAAAEVFLVNNYRSTQGILDLSYRFICQNNPYRLEVKLANDKKGGGKGLVKKLKALSKSKGEISHLAFETADDEVKGVLKKIVAIKEDDTDATWNDFAILARTNDVAGIFSYALSQTQIPHRFMASRGLYTKPVILDVLAYLRLLDNYHESSAVYRILNSPIVGLDDKAIVQLNYWAKRKGYSLYATLEQPDVMADFKPDVVKKIQAFLGWVGRHAQLAREKSVGEIIMAFLEDTGYLKLLTAKGDQELLEATGYLNQFHRRVVEFEQAGRGQLVKDFLDMIDLELEAGETGSLDQNLDEGPEAVKVLTVHAAKGLEFKYVFIVNLVDRRFPTDDRPDAISLPDSLVKELLPEGDVHLQEERRLFYVAMTRTKLGLYFTSATDYGGVRKKKVSRFLQELGSLGLSIVEKGESVDKDKVRISQSIRVPRKQNLSSADIAYLLPKRFSFSQLTSFTRCPYHYWLEHVLKIPQRGKNYFSFGSSLHLTLQRFFEKVKERAETRQPDLFGAVATAAAGKPLVSLAELLELYEQNWIDDWYHNRTEHDQYKTNGKKILKTFYQRYEEQLPVPKVLETLFNLAITDEAGAAYAITGKIDRVDPYDGGAEIIDYKTGKGKTAETLDTDDKRQLLIYHLAAEQYLGEQVKKLTYYYLDENHLLSFAGTEKDFDALKKWIIKTIMEIRQYPFPAKISDCTCRAGDGKIF